MEIRARSDGDLTALVEIADSGSSFSGEGADGTLVPDEWSWTNVLLIAEKPA